MSLEDAAELAAVNEEMNSPVKIHCQNCGTPFQVRPEDVPKASCSQCHSSLVRRYVLTKPPEIDYRDWRVAIKSLFLTSAVIYFIVQFVLKPTKYEIVHVESQGRDVNGLYLSKRTYLFWGHARYKLEFGRDGGLYYYADGVKHTSLPNDL